MEYVLEQIREQQKESWNRFSPGWKKWDDLFMDFLNPMGTEIIRLLNPKNNDQVLDVASGTGEPGLTIATMLKEGKVLMTDLSYDMLIVAREKAVKKGIYNIETCACDACDLPFSNAMFDAVSCRFGFMFFPDMLMAAKEMVRVLRPGGRVAASVWNVPEKNFWITAMMSTINRHMQLPPPPVNGPGMFRAAGEGVLAKIFSQAGLKNVTVKEVSGKMNCKTADVYWNVMTEVAAPIVAALASADAQTRAKIKDEVFQALSQKYPDGNIVIDSSALVVYGEK